MSIFILGRTLVSVDRANILCPPRRGSRVNYEVDRRTFLPVWSIGSPSPSDYFVGVCASRWYDVDFDVLGE